MRFGAGFGLLSLLIVIAIGFYLSYGGPGGGAAGNALQVKKDLEPQVQQMAGRDADGARVTDAITLDLHTTSGGKIDAVVVETIDSASTLASKYDLQVGDLITQIGDINIREPEVTDADAAKDLLLGAYQKSGALRVTRGSSKLTIAFGKKTAVPLSTPQSASPPPAAPTTPATPPQTPPDTRSGLQKQLDDIAKPR